MLRVSLDRYLRQHDLTAYRLVKETGGRVARGSVYALARGEEVKRVDLETLSEVMAALHRITGQEVTPNDLLEVIEQQSDAEEGALLSSGVQDLAATLADLEGDTAAEEMDAWHGAFEASA